MPAGHPEELGLRTDDAVPEDRAARPPRGDGPAGDAARDRAAQRLRAARATPSRGSRELYEFRDFAHFIEVWILTTNALRTADDFRQVVVDYAAEAASHGAVYLEGIFSPGERVRRGVGWDDIFSGYCDGAQEARELTASRCA